MLVKIVLLIVFFAVMVGVGVYSRKHATSVSGFVLGGRSVGPWLTAFAYGTSYFSAVVFVGYAGQFGWKYGMASTWIGLGNAIIGSLLGSNALAGSSVTGATGDAANYSNLLLIAAGTALLGLIVFFVFKKKIYEGNHALETEESAK